MDSVISQLQSAGLIIDGMPHVGRLVRCKVDSDTGRKESGWYVLHDLVLDNGDHVYVGRYGNWKTMGDESLPIEFDKPVSALDKERIAKQQRDIRENAEMEKRLRAESAAKRAKEIWEKLPGAGASQYLMRKRVGAHGLRFSRGSLVVPVHTTAGELVGLQFIAADGSKKFLTGTAKKGCFHRIGRLGHGYPLCICEGYATGASIWEVMDWPVAIAFDAGNLLPVAKALREKYPDQKIIICADNDCATPGNPGVTKAREAAVAIGAQLAVPVFPEGGGCVMAGLTDFNDLHVVQGTDAVRAQLELVVSSAAANHPVVDIPPDDFYDHYEPSRALPEDGGGFGKWNLIDLVRHVSLIYGTDTVWDAREKIQMRRSYLSHIIGRELFKEWDNHPSRRVVKGLVFEPSGVIPENTVNLFNGFSTAPGTRGAVGCKRILQHIYRLCGFRDEEFEWLMRWIAYPLQNPGAKMDTSVVMHGSEGTGKSLIWELVVGKIYGEYMVTVGQQQIESQFTGWQSQKCLALCEEVVARSEKAHYKGMLKHLVTGKTLTVNEKQLPERAETNHLQFVFLSNSMTPLELDLGDRRYMVLYITDVPDQAYFDDLIAEIDGGGVAEFYRHLLDLDMKGFNGHTKPPLNAEKRDLIAAGMPNALLFYQDWKDGHLGLEYGPCPAGVLYRAYTRWCKHRNEFPRNQRAVVPEWRRHLFERVARIDLGVGYGDKKPMRIYVPNELKDRVHDAGFTAVLEAGCRAFVHSFDAQKDEEYVS